MAAAPISQILFMTRAIHHRLCCSWHSQQSSDFINSFRHALWSPGHSAAALSAATNDAGQARWLNVTGVEPGVTEMPFVTQPRDTLEPNVASTLATQEAYYGNNLSHFACHDICHTPTN